jgi:hypothetical protein
MITTQFDDRHADIRDAVRAYWLGRGVSRGEFARRFTASSDVFHHGQRAPLDPGSAGLIVAVPLPADRRAKDGLPVGASLLVVGGDVGAAVMALEEPALLHHLERRHRAGRMVIPLLLAGCGDAGYPLAVPMLVGPAALGLDRRAREHDLDVLRLAAVTFDAIAKQRLVGGAGHHTGSVSTFALT